MIDEAVQNKGNITGLTTGFKQIDEMTAGLQPGNLVIIAGRPGMGKTGICPEHSRKKRHKCRSFSTDIQYRNAGGRNRTETYFHAWAG